MVDMVVGFTTTCTISAYHHKSCDFKPGSWCCVHDTTLCDKSLSVTCDRGLFFLDFFIYKNDRHDITDILLNVVLDTINQPTNHVILVKKREHLSQISPQIYHVDQHLCRKQSEFLYESMHY